MKLKLAAVAGGRRELVRQVGAVTAFDASSKQLAADKLTECNQSARR
jgi:hypothetical protein